MTKTTVQQNSSAKGVGVAREEYDHDPIGAAQKANETVIVHAIDLLLEIENLSGQSAETIAMMRSSVIEILHWTRDVTVELSEARSVVDLAERVRGEHALTHTGSA